MTEPQQQKEYIITDEQLRSIDDDECDMTTIGEIVLAIRSRPLPYKNVAAQARAAGTKEGAAQEREKVLGEIFQWLCDMDGGDMVYNPKLGLFSIPGSFNAVGLVHKLEFLWHSKEQQP